MSYLKSLSLQNVNFTEEGKYLNFQITCVSIMFKFEQDGESVLEWSPVQDDGKNAPAVFYAKKDGEGGEEETNFDPGYEPDWAVIGTVKQNREKEKTPVRDTGHWGSFSLPLSELYSLRRARFSLGRNFMVLTSRGGDPLPPLHFHRGGTRELFRAMQRYIRLVPSVTFLTLSFLPCSPKSSGTLKQGALRPPESPLHSRSPPEPNSAHPPDDEPGFELITCGAELGPRPKVTRGQPLDNWEQFLDPEGRVTDPQKVKELVFRGGIIPSLRKEVWKFLLGFYPWNSTAKEREDIIRVKTDEYFRMKVQWKSVSEEQEMRNSLLRGYRSLIELFSFFSRQDGAFDSIELLAFNDISDLFFQHKNFEESQEAMKQQLLQLSLLLKALDPELCDYLDSQDSGSLCFCFRWLLIWYKREFSFEDILNLWEVLWTRLPCENVHLLMACAILESQRGELIGSNHDFNTILKHINELNMKLDLQTVLQGAEGIYLQLAQCKELSVKVQEVLGLYVASSSEEGSPDLEPKETDTLLSQAEARGASSCQPSSSYTASPRPPPTYP
uniref:TBC1 domain family, member 17 n=1 Tax=Astyanax mexicanus TaxID=7994 RepID=A0A8B9HIT0_ASTMX